MQGPAGPLDAQGPAGGEEGGGRSPIASPVAFWGASWWPRPHRWQPAHMPGYVAPDASPQPGELLPFQSGWDMLIPSHHGQEQELLAEEMF